MSGGQVNQRLADYFVICGLDERAGIEPDHLSGDNLHAPPLDRPFKCSVLSHYPENVPWNPFDESAVAMLCHPRGVHFKTQGDQRHSYFHTFLITKEDGAKTYGAVYTFYEKVQSQQICQAMQTLQNMHMAELSNVQSHALYSHLGNRVFDRSPRHQAKKAEEAPPQRTFDSQRDTLYVSKSLSVISQLPLFIAFKKFLKILLDSVFSASKPELPWESYIYNIIHEVPLPPPGRSMKFFTFRQHPIVCQRPSNTELPLLEYPLKEMFSLLGVENVLSIFVCMMLEHQILLYSQDCQRLMMVAESVTALGFPFSWQHVYVPILPASLLHFLDAPVPYIMGLHHTTDGDKLKEHCGQGTVCFVNIDEATVETPEDLPTLPYKEEIHLDLVQQLKRSADESDKSRLSTDTLYQLKRVSTASTDSGMSSGAASTSSSMCNISNKLEILHQQSEALAKIAAIAKKTGVISSLEDISGSFMEEANSASASQGLRAHYDKDTQDLLANVILREVFLHYILQLFQNYESFVIMPNQDMETWISNRETMQTFDKAAFLGDHPEAHLPFLAAFIETQMFTTFIDNKIVAQWDAECDPNLKVFEARLKKFQENNADGMTSIRFSRTYGAMESMSMVEKRNNVIDHIAMGPHSLEGLRPPIRHEPGKFPSLDAGTLNQEPNAKGKRDNAKWRRKDRVFQHSEHLGLSNDQREYSLVEKHARAWLRYMQEARAKGIRQPKLSEMTGQGMKQTNYKFVESLLSECKAKTKRMLVEKMGQEAIELGHADAGTITGVEENTLIASLCDLLERVWSHGAHNKQGKSALWSHLLKFQEEETRHKVTTDPTRLTPGKSEPEQYGQIIKMPALNIPTLNIPTLNIMQRSLALVGQQGIVALAGGMLEDFRKLSLDWDEDRSFSLFTGTLDRRRSRSKSPYNSPYCGSLERGLRQHRRRGSKGMELPDIKPLPISLTYDMRNIQQMGDVKTQVGYTRAFVRLALEKKLLSTHLKELLSNTDLVRRLYKRYAFLRSEDEKEQFLFHLLSLNAVDYHCFSNTFTNTVVNYKVLIFPNKKVGSSTSANAWMILAGNQGETHTLEIPKYTLEFSVQHKNLGVLTTLRIGHDNSGMSPKWLIEHILVRNEITAHTYRFPCGRWLGKGVDDGSTERLLVAEIVPPSTDHEDLMETCRTPPRSRSPSMSRKNNESKMKISEIQELLGDAVNNLVKYFYKPEKERGSLTSLLCGEYGLVFCMENVFQCGFRSTRLFRNRFFIWDFLEKVQLYFDTLLRDDDRCELESNLRGVMKSFCRVVVCINAASQNIGKDGKFQLFICIGVRDHVIQRWIIALSDTPATISMYEERSFLRDPMLLTFLVQILESLDDFDIKLEASLMKGIHL